MSGTQDELLIGKELDMSSIVNIINILSPVGFNRFNVLQVNLEPRTFPFIGQWAYHCPNHDKNIALISLKTFTTEQ